MEYTRFEGIDKKVSKFFMGTLFMFMNEKEKHFATWFVQERHQGLNPGEVLSQ